MADPTAAYYISGTALSIVGVLGGARSYYARQRKRWTEEGAQGQKNTEALDANTKAAAANTSAVAQLTTKLDKFADDTRRELAEHHIRIGRLEDVVEAPMGTRRRRGTGETT
jgi:hypothetical protein